MKMYSLIMTCLLALFISSASAQTVDEIITNYLENTGGLENWKSLESIQIEAKVSQGGMEIPLSIVQTKEGKQMTTITFQGMTIKQGVFDGETLWNTNMQTMKPEKAAAELTQVQKLESNDFPESFIDYKEKGYTAELMGKETIEGAETFKVKLVKEPITIDGEEVENAVYYYFDTEAFIPIAQETEVKVGPQKGVMTQTKMSDYQEVDGFFFPFSMSQGVKDGPSQPIEIVSITLNPELDEKAFAYPASE